MHLSFSSNDIKPHLMGGLLSLPPLSPGGIPLPAAWLGISSCRGRPVAGREQGAPSPLELDQWRSISRRVGLVQSSLQSTAATQCNAIQQHVMTTAVLSEFVPMSPEATYAPGHASDITLACAGGQGWRGHIKSTVKL